VPTKENTIYLKVSKKLKFQGKKFQLNFMNGYNILVDKKTVRSVKVEDSVVYDIPKRKSQSTYLLLQKHMYTSLMVNLKASSQKSNHLNYTTA
jgi:ribosomal protein S4E